MSEEIQHFHQIQEINAHYGLRTLHPLVSVYAFGEITNDRPLQRRSCDFYTIYLKEKVCGEITYGRSTYDYQDGTMIFIGPGQVYGKNASSAPAPSPSPAVSVSAPSESEPPKGWALLFHPDLLRRTSLAGKMRSFTFFSYDSNEALHLSDEELTTVKEIFRTLRQELEHPLDAHSRSIIVSQIEVLLNYCVRFYDRQFISREETNHDILARFEALLDEYFERTARTQGLPSVQYCAEQLHLSPNYFSSLVKRETGRTPAEHIHGELIRRAKTLLTAGEQNVSEVAYLLGFKYPQHLTRIFKQHTGQTPQEYKTLN